MKKWELVDGIICCRSCSSRSTWLLYVQLVNKEKGKDVGSNDKAIHCPKETVKCKPIQPTQKGNVLNPMQLAKSGEGTIRRQASCFWVYT